MPMRGSARRTVRVSPSEFQWDRALAAVLRHSTLPWNDAIAVAPLVAGDFGARDRLSLLAQFSGHQAALRFAGIADGEIDAAEWMVCRQRGMDVRLVRIAAREPDPDTAPPALTLSQQFAEAVGASPLDVFRQSWARAESVYIECYRRLRDDAETDLRWTRGAAAAWLLSPGEEVLRTLEPGRYVWSDLRCVDALRSFGRRVVVVSGGSILRFSALHELSAVVGPLDGASESDIVEKIAGEKLIFVIPDPDAVDAGTRGVLQMLPAVADAVIVAPRSWGGAPLPETRAFVVAPTIALSRSALRCDPSMLIASSALDRLLLRGEEVAVGTLSLNEPARSYVAVLALLGASTPGRVAARLLREFTTDVALEELVFDGVTRLDESFHITTPEEAVLSIPEASMPAVCRIAARVASEEGDRAGAARLLVRAGDPGAAADILEGHSWRSDDEAIRTLERIPPSALSATQCLHLSTLLTDAGRYRDARDVAVHLDGASREIALATIERRTGDYEPALSRLERLPRGPESDLLRAEILLVLRREEEARDLLDSSSASGDRAEYLRCLACGRKVAVASRYLAARLATYAALDACDAATALHRCEEAVTESTSTATRIDALLDRVYTLFHGGRWPEARAAAWETLAVVEETQGDRAAGGLIFLLAYLAADDGQWAHAAQRITRLRLFYASTRDERHLEELDLLAAHLDFSRGRFDAARRVAASLLDRAPDAPIREAASLIVDEIDLISGRTIPQRPVPQNVEFRRRYEYLRGGAPPENPTGPQRFRVALKCGDTRTAAEIAAALGIECDTRSSPGDLEVRVLRAVLSHDFPMPTHAIDVPWRYAVRNRLGQWQQSGSSAPAAPGDLDAALQEPGDGWIVCSDRELVYLEGARRLGAEAREAIAAAFRSRAELVRLQRLADLTEAADRPRMQSHGIVGDSAPIRDLIDRISLIARRDVAVCILGESGTGKELVARAIHTGSPRRSKTFTPVNCAALPENLIESELFGHVRGAFTGADRDRAGLIESTNGGTIFLDEIGEMPMTAQAKLLRFLQDGEFRRVGETTSRSADVRIVTATNRKLDEAVEQGRFREDLYYRIRGVEIVLPALRERGNDILLLAQHFLAAERARHKGGAARLSDEVEALFLSYSWPGNVRELQNTVRAAHAIAGDAAEIALEHLPDRVRNVKVGRVLSGSYQDAVMRFRRDLIENALREAKGNQNRAASLLRMSRQALGYQIRELGILTGKG